MKLFFMSDIHGSVYFLKKALENFKREAADYICILGDQLYHGARNPLPPEYNPKEAAQLLNGYSKKIIAIRGNCDSEVDEMVLEYPIMATYSTVLLGRRRLFLTHGHVYSPETQPPLNDGDILAFGHIHLPIAEKRGNIYIYNPGSITFPKENFPNSYGTLEDETLKIKNLDGKTFKEITLE